LVRINNPSWIKGGNVVSFRASFKLTKSLRAFAEGLVDYAGLFPPATLELPQVVKNYIGYHKWAESWMLARLICPITQLNELGKNIRMLGGVEKKIGVIGLVGTTASSTEIGTNINTFHQKYGDSAQIEAIESKLNESSAKEAVSSLVSLTPYTTFFETTNSDRIDELLKLLQQVGAGFKLRCGGLKPEEFPSAEELARSIILCREAKVPMKFTAGLHHPLRHYNQTTLCKMHGFVNVFGGAMLAHVHHLPQKELENILSDEESSHFKFTEDAFHWNDLSIDVETITSLRQSRILSYGSCSFEEPIDDMKELGWLP